MCISYESVHVRITTITNCYLHIFRYLFNCQPSGFAPFCIYRYAFNNYYKHFIFILLYFNLIQ